MALKKEAVSLGVVGAGDWGKNILRNLSELPETELAACCDKDPKALAFVKEHYRGTALFDNVESFLSQAAMDGVIISSPASTHYGIAEKALLSGRHVFVEKPLTFLPSEAEALVETARRAGRILMVGHLMQYHPAVVWIRSWLRENRLGRIYYAVASRSNLGRIRGDESVLWSLGPHDISLFLDFFQSDPLSVQAQGAAFHCEGKEDVVFATLLFPDAVAGHLHLSRLTPHKVRRFSLVGNKAMLDFDDMENREKVKIYYSGRKEEISYESYGEAISLRFGDIALPGIEMAEPLRVECSHFARCIAEGREPDTGGGEGIRVVRVLEALERSLKDGGRQVSL